MEPEQTIAREMALFRVSAAVENRGEIMQFADIFRGRDHRRLAAHADDRDHGHRRQDRGVRAHGPPARPVEMARTGEVAITRSRPRPDGRREPTRRHALDSLSTRSSARAAARPRAAPGQRHGPDRRLRPERGRVRLAAAPTTAGSAGSSPTATASRSPRSARAHEVVSRGRRAASTTSSRDCADAAPGPARRRAVRACPPARGRCGSGGFAFEADGGARAALVVASAGAAGHARARARCAAAASAYLTLSAIVGAGADRRRAATRGSLAASPRCATTRCRCSTRARARDARSRSVAPAGPTTSASSRRRSTRIRAGELDKVVLAREVEVEAPAAHDPAALFGALRELFPACFCFCVGTPEAAFIGASPELLVRRSGAVAATVALAGSTRRSADPAVDDHLGEQLLRSRQGPHRARDRRAAHRARAAAALGLGRGRRRAGLVKVANIQHLATPIHAQLAEPRSAVELAGAAAPDAGRRRRAARRRRSRRSPSSRGWTAAGTRGRSAGWTRPRTASSASRCAARCSATARAHLFAGCGIVADSDPAAELAETEIKLEALLPLLAG